MNRRTFLQGAGALAFAGLSPTGAFAAPAFTALGNVIPLAITNSQAINATVAARDAGGYFAAWSGVEHSGSVQRQAWYARRFAADGKPATVVHQIEGNYTGVTVVALADGNALVFGTGNKIVVGRTLTAAGFGARSVTIGDAEAAQPLATRLTNGNILVVWHNGKVYGRILTSAMTPIGKAFLISNTAGVQHASEMAIAPLASGGAVVALRIVRADGLHYIVQRVSPGGSTVGAPLRPPRLAALSNTGVRIGVAAMPQGRFALLWHGSEEFGGQIFSDAGATVAPIASIRSKAATRFVTTIPAVASGGEIIVAPAAGGVTFAAFDGATGKPTRPFTTLRTDIGDCNSLARLTNGTLVASTFGTNNAGYQGWLQRYKLG